MAGVGGEVPTLIDVATRMDPDGNTGEIVEILSTMNPMLLDAPAVECNGGTKHRSILRTSLPSPAWRVLNRGVPTTKSTTVPVEDTTAIMQTYGEIDEDLVDGQASPEAFRLTESTAHIEGMGQEGATALLYHDTNTDPEKILGLAPRFNALTGADNSNQIIDGGGSGSDNTSIWMIVWGMRTCHLIYPKGTKAGIEHEDLGKQLVYDDDGNKFQAWVDQFKHKIGLAIRDWRYIVRIANIDVSDLTTDASTGANIFQLLKSAYWQLAQRRITEGTSVIYANATIMEFLDHQADESNSNVHLRWEQMGKESEPVLWFRNMQIREDDAILDTEAEVT